MKYILAEMEIVTFIDSENCEKYSYNNKVMTYERDPKYCMKICLVDMENKRAYNIYNLDESFPVLKRNKDYFLLPNQKIELGIEYAIKERELKKDLNYLYRKYLLEKKQEEKQMVKKNNFLF